MDIFDNNCDGEESQGQSEYNNNSCLDSNSDDDICHDKKLQNDHDNRKKGWDGFQKRKNNFTNYFCYFKKQDTLAHQLTRIERMCSFIKNKFSST